MRTTGSTASAFRRYVNDISLSDFVAYALSSLFSIALALNVLFWLPRAFGLRILHPWYAVGYIIGVVVISEVYRALLRGANTTRRAMQAWRFNLGEKTWALAQATAVDAVDPVDGKGQK